MKNDWSAFTTLQFQKYAEHYVKMNFIAARCAIYEDAGGSRGVDFVVKNEKAQYVDIYLTTVYIGKTNYVAIPKYYWENDSGKTCTCRWYCLWLNTNLFFT